MSSGEWFALMIRARPNGRLIGDRTRGASGSPREFTLANGVSYAVSTWIAYDASKQPFEDRGIQPDVPVAADRSFDAERDYVVEQALRTLASMR